MKKISLCTALILAICCFASIGTAAEQQTLPDGFIAISENPMTWEDAKTLCQQQGGRLPRINNMDSWNAKNPPLQGIPIDGFGNAGRPWNEVGLPNDDFYWTDTVYSDRPGFSFAVRGDSGKVHLAVNAQGGLRRVACVPK